MQYLKKHGDPDGIFYVYTDALAARGDMVPYNPVAQVVIEDAITAEAETVEVPVAKIIDETAAPVGYQVVKYSGQWHEIIGPDGAVVARGLKKDEADAKVAELLAATAPVETVPVETAPAAPAITAEAETVEVPVAVVETQES